MGIGGGIGGGLGNPIHHGIAPLTRPCCLFLVSRGLVNAGDGYAEDNTEGHLTHGTPGLDAARPPSSGTGTVSSGWTPSALGPGVAICYLPQQVATGITTPLCLCLASELASSKLQASGLTNSTSAANKASIALHAMGEGDGMPFGYLPVSRNEAVNCTVWHSTVVQAWRLAFDRRDAWEIRVDLRAHAVTGRI